MFVDEVDVRLRAGHGGHGCVSFRRAKFEPKGGPNGGDGGKGGDVILRCNENVGDLVDFHFRPTWQAGDGEKGKGSDMTGRGGEDVILNLPPGTVVFQGETGQRVTEVTEHGQEVVLLRGGRGGLGNIHFKSATNRAPRQSTPGQLGEEGRFRLVLKTMAEVGLVGFPNAGKSTLITQITKAHPRTAAYPFTTLHPNVGYIEYPDRYDRLRLADIPGLIADAHLNKGLGHRFLRHIERCRALLILLDMAGTDGRQPLDDFRVLLSELGHYDSSLLEKPRLVVANKMDEPEAAEALKLFRQSLPDLPIHPISCLSGEGLPELKEALRDLVRSLPSPPPTPTPISPEEDPPP